MPMTFSAANINALTVAPDRPGGFTTTDLGRLYEILSNLGRLFEVPATRRKTRALLDAYLGSHAAGQAELGFGIGLHIGEVTYGNIGSAEWLEFTVIGEAANRAARIESMCKLLQRDILLSAEFAQYFPERVESLGCHELRGSDSGVKLLSLRD